MSSTTDSKPPRTALDSDLLDLPGLRWFKHRWSNTTFANGRTRREAKVLMFRELAVAAAHNVPLETALDLCARSAGEHLSSGPGKRDLGADTRRTGCDFLMALMYVLVAPVAISLYILTAFRAADVEAVTRVLARRLRERVRKGLSLSQAMTDCAPDYSDQELRIVEAGEASGDMASCLRILSDSQAAEQRLALQANYLVYPLLLWHIVLLLVTFIYVFVVPKFKDIYDQLGGELPGLTLILIGFLRTGIYGLGTVFTTALVLVITLMVLRALMNGSRLSKLLLTIPILVSPLYLISLAEIVLSNTTYGGQMSDEAKTVVHMTVGASGLALALVFFPLVLRLLELIVLAVERRVAGIFRYMPVIGRAVRAQLEAQWLGAFSMAITAGMNEPDALLAAGKACGGRLETRSIMAAGNARRGKLFGDACLEADVLLPALNHRLVLIQQRPDLRRNLANIANDAAQEACEVAARTGRIAEVFAVTATPVILSAFIISIYLPLFNIPLLVMTSGL